MLLMQWLGDRSALCKDWFILREGRSQRSTTFGNRSGNGCRRLLRAPLVCWWLLRVTLVLRNRFSGKQDRLISRRRAVLLAPARFLGAGGRGRRGTFSRGRH